MDSDKLDVKLEFGDFKRGGLKAGDSLPEYKLRFDLLLQKLNDFEQGDQYSDQEKMKIFLDPLKRFPNRFVSNQVVDWLADPGTMPTTVVLAYRRLTTLFETGQTDFNYKVGGDRNAKVHTAKEFTVMFDG